MKKKKEQLKKCVPTENNAVLRVEIQAQQLK